MSEVIAIVNQKGGCAKTTTAVNLGVGLAVYSDVVGQAFYFRPDNCRMVLGQLPRAFRTHLDVPESPWNPGVWGWKTPKKVDWHFVRFRCGICPLVNRALSIFRAALRSCILLPPRQFFHTGYSSGIRNRAASDKGFQFLRSFSNIAPAGSCKNIDFLP